jgi:putative transposase
VGKDQYRFGAKSSHQPGTRAKTERRHYRQPKRKTSEGGEERGVDVHKQVPGRKRHIIIDTLGLLLLVLVHRASIPDGNSGKLVLAGLFERIKHSVYNRWCRFKLIWADGAYEDISAWVK